MYGSDGSLTGLIFESLEFRVPNVNELAEQLSAIKEASLAKFKNAECLEDSHILAEQLLDWDFLYVLGKVLDIDIPERTDSEKKMSNTTMLDFVRENNLANLMPESLDMKVKTAKALWHQGKSETEIEEVVGKEVLLECQKRGEIPIIGGRSS